MLQPLPLLKIRASAMFWNVVRKRKVASSDAACIPAFVEINQLIETRSGGTLTHTHTAGRLQKPKVQQAENPALQNKMQNKFLTPRVTRTVTPVHRLSPSTQNSANFHALTSLTVHKKTAKFTGKKVF